MDGRKVEESKTKRPVLRRSDLVRIEEDASGDTTAGLTETAALAETAGLTEHQQANLARATVLIPDGVRDNARQQLQRQFQQPNFMTHLLSARTHYEKQVAESRHVSH